MSSMSAYKTEKGPKKLDLEFGKSKINFVMSKAVSDVKMKMDTQSKIQKMRKIRRNSIEYNI